MAGWFHTSSPREKTYVEFGVIDCIIQLSVNGINLPVTCDETSNKRILFMSLAYFLSGFNIVKTFIKLLALDKACASERTYWKWFFIEPLMFFVYVGVPTSMFFFRRLILH